MAGDKHRLDVTSIQQELLQIKAKKQSLCIRSNKSSNSLRKNEYRNTLPRLSVNKLNRILGVDVEKRVVSVEPHVTMEQLAQATLPYGYLPPVVPEFKGITVGGAIMGAAIESSSYRYGQFNDACLAMEVLLGDGQVITATPKQYDDLFYGLSSSYGTLGVLTAVDIALVPAEKWVELTCRELSSVNAAIAYMVKLTSRGDAPDFLEAIVYSKERIIVISGRMRKEKAAHAPELNHCSSTQPWYYCYIDELLKNSQQKNAVQFYMPIYDYLFRHNRGAFWMGAYALRFPFLASFVLENYFPKSRSMQNWLLQANESLFRPKYPGPIFRKLFGRLMESQKLYQIMHANSTEKWFGERFVIQDFYITEGQAANFIEESLNETGITPIWICPVKAAKEPQILSPHYQSNPGLLFDVGIYGYPQHRKGFEATRKLEDLTTTYKGKKMLYSHSYYTPDEFWKIYSLPAYQQLRKKYNAEGVFKEITEKVLRP